MIAAHGLRPAAYISVSLWLDILPLWCCEDCACGRVFKHPALFYELLGHWPQGVGYRCYQHLRSASVTSRLVCVSNGMSYVRRTAR